MKRAKYLSTLSVDAVAKNFGIEMKSKAGKKMSDANEWIPTEAVKKIKEIQN